MGAKENAVVKAVLDFLKLKGVFAWRNQSTGIYDGKRWRPAHTIRGVSDIIAVHNGTAYFIECKTATGRLSKYQADFRDAVTKAGGVFILARGVADVSQLDWSDNGEV